MRIIKGLLLVLCFGLLNVYASEYNNISVNDTTNFEDNSISIKEVKYEIYDGSFGLTGKVINSYDSRANISIKVSFYDNNGYLVTEELVNKSVVSGESNLNLIFDNGILGSKKASDISTYSVSLTGQKDETPINTELYPSGKSEYTHYGYVIDGYNVRVVVNKNNTYDVTETIEVYFYNAVESITREIPLNGYTIKDYNVKDITISEEQSENYKVRMIVNGEASTRKQYVITYKVVMSEEHKDIDFDVIPKWDTVIGNPSITITLSKETSLDDVVVTYDGNVNKSTNNTNEIYINSTDFIENKSINVKLDLPDGYFSNNSSSIVSSNTLKYLLIGTGVIIVGIVVLTLIKSKSKEKIETL